MTDVALKEHLEALIRSERELRELSARQVAHALSLQAREVERRLAILNGEHGRLAELTGTFLRQETFQAWLKSASDADDRSREIDLNWKSNVDKQLAEQRGANARTAVTITVGLALLSVALRFWP